MPKALMAGMWCAILIVFAAPLNVRAEFYTFEENRIVTHSDWQDPAEIFSALAKATTNLLKWTIHDQTRPVAIEKYERLRHFGTWVDDWRTNDCYDTRAIILARDSETEVGYSTTNQCKVFSGTWADPYSGQTFKLAREIEVDHVVALKNAYDSGAWGWDYQHRCLYANFTGFENHLISVSMPENRRKGDRGPERWMPSNDNYACQHLQNWLVVKYIWNLNMSDEEAVAIENQIKFHGCTAKSFQYSTSEINKARRFAVNNLELCESH